LGDWIDPRFDPMSTALATAIFLYLLLVAPLLGRWRYAALRRQRGTDPGALRSYYRRAIVVGLLMAALVGLMVALSPGLDPADVGVRLPERGERPVAVILLAAFLLAMAISGLRLRRMLRRGVVPPLRVGIVALLPRTDTERRWAVATSLATGVWEEIVFRGLAIAVGVGLLDLHPITAAALGTVAFVLPHLYQGPVGLLSAGYFGVLFAMTYILSGTIVVGVVLHAANNTVALLVGSRTPLEPSSPDPVQTPTV
jgi:membrane protease YdiL (CAAX protease family)